jgi:hypothetical protein
VSEAITPESSTDAGVQLRAPASKTTRL